MSGYAAFQSFSLPELMHNMQQVSQIVLGASPWDEVREDWVRGGPTYFVHFVVLGAALYDGPASQCMGSVDTLERAFHVHRLHSGGKLGS